MVVRIVAGSRGVVKADEVDYHWDSGELEPSGNVHLQPIAK